MIREHWEERFRKRLELSRSKEEDWGDGGRKNAVPNANFHRVAELCRTLKVDITKPDGVAQFHIINKLDRMCNLLRDGRTPNNESVEDTLADMQNYIDILQDIREEGRNAGPSVKFHENYAKKEFPQKEEEIPSDYVGIGMTCEEFPKTREDPNKFWKSK